MGCHFCWVSFFRCLLIRANAGWHYRCVNNGKNYMKQQDATTPKPQEGSGSAENTGRDRREQKNNKAAADTSGMAEASGSNQHLVNLHDMGALSGRDDYAGGSGDNMENESTNESTERSS